MALFLLREPREVLTSLARVLPNPRLEDMGLPQQLEIFDLVRQRSGRVPPVLDARDVLEEPERLLRLLCAALDVEFTPAMLSWPPGPRARETARSTLSSVGSVMMRSPVRTSG